jgi:hypothetical protein
MRRHLSIMITILTLSIVGMCDLTSAQAAAVGTVTRLRGEANAQAAGKTHALAESGEVDMGDRLLTGPGARLEVKFVDGTVLTLGEKADFTIDELTVTPGKGVALFTRVTGAIRLVGGDVTKQAEHKMEVASNAGTIGIRGTDVWGGTVKPGSQLDVFLIEGAVEVRNAAGTVVLDQAGLGTSVTAAGGAPVAPTQWPQALRDRAIATVSFDSP